MIKIEDGLEIHRPLEKKSQALVVMLHGYGADESDMIGWVKQWAAVCPQVTYGVLRAPERCDHGHGFQWFPLTSLIDNSVGDALICSASQGLAFLSDKLDAWRKRLGFTWQQVIIGGFSQGSYMALHLGLMHQPVKAILGYSGGLMLAPGDVPCYDPEIFLFHGWKDDVIPVERAYEAHKKLTHHSQKPVTMVVDPHCAHTCSKEGLQAGVKFLKTQLDRLA